MDTPIWTHHFDSVSEIVERAFSGRVVDERNQVKYDRLIGRLGDSWFNHHDKASLLAALDNPPEFTARIDTLKADLEVKSLSTRNTRKLAYRQADGEELDAHGALMRDPDAWSAIRKTPARSNRVMRIAVNLSVNCGREPKDLYYRGAAAAALADALTGAGYAVEIVAFEAADGYGRPCDKAVLSVTVKRPDMPLDIGLVAFVLSDIGFVRGVVFPTIFALMPQDCSSSLGCPMRLPSEIAKDFDIVLDSNILTQSAAAKVVKQWADDLIANYA